MDPSHGLIWPQYKGQYNKSHLLQHGITWGFITLKVKRKLSKLCAARSLAANRQRKAISTDVRMRDAISSGSRNSGDKKELVPKQRHVIEAELAPKRVSWTGLTCFGPKKLFSFYGVKLLALILYNLGPRVLSYSSLRSVETGKRESWERGWLKVSYLQWKERKS